MSYLRPALYAACVLGSIKVTSMVRKFDGTNAFAEQAGAIWQGILGGIKRGSIDDVKQSADTSLDKIEDAITEHVSRTVVIGTVAGVTLAAILDEMVLS